MRVTTSSIQACENKLLPDGPKDKRPLPKNLPRPAMHIGFSGKTGSGKSNALIRMLMEYQKKDAFQKIILISPTASTDKKYDSLNLTEKHEKYTDTLLEQLVQTQKDDMEEHTEEAEKMEVYKRYMKRGGKTKWTHEELVLLTSLIDPMTGELVKPEMTYEVMPWAALILDDLGGTATFRNGNTSLNSHVCKARHYNMSIICAVQHIYQIPRSMRQQLSNLIVFTNRDQKVMKEIAAECCSDLSPDEFLHLFEQATKDGGHDFLYCDFRKNEFRKNFNTRLHITNTSADEQPQLISNRKDKCTSRTPSSTAPPKSAPPMPTPGCK